jgi:hypothetical protein
MLIKLFSRFFIIFIIVSSLFIGNCLCDHSRYQVVHNDEDYKALSQEIINYYKKTNEGVASVDNIDELEEVIDINEIPEVKELTWKQKMCVAAAFAKTNFCNHIKHHKKKYFTLGFVLACIIVAHHLRKKRKIIH